MVINGCGKIIQIALDICTRFTKKEFTSWQKENERKIVFFKLIDRKYRLCYGKYSCQSSTPLHSFHFYEQDYDGT